MSEGLYTSNKQEIEAWQMWAATKVAAARGLAQSMMELPTDVRLKGIEENAAEIERLLASYPGQAA